MQWSPTQAPRRQTSCCCAENQCIHARTHVRAQTHTHTSHTHTHTHSHKHKRMIIRIKTHTQIRTHTHTHTHTRTHTHTHSHTWITPTSLAATACSSSSTASCSTHTHTHIHTHTPTPELLQHHWLQPPAAALPQPLAPRSGDPTTAAAALRTQKERAFFAHFTLSLVACSGGIPACLCAPLFVWVVIYKMDS